MNTVPSSREFKMMMLLTLWYYNVIYKSRCYWSPAQIGELKTAFIKIKLYSVCFKDD